MTEIIAEVGVNHNGDFDTAKRLVDAAKEAGADTVKFQCFKAEHLDPPGERRDTLRELQLAVDDFAALKNYCKDKNIDFMATPFSKKWATFLVKELGCKKIKIASGSLYMEEMIVYLRHKAYPGPTIYWSTGMGSYPDFYKQNDVIMHCVSQYPCDIVHINLGLLEKLIDGYNDCIIGLSDHTTSTVVPALAVALGAKVIEKHITLDSSQAGPDHHMSLEPDEFRDMVKNVRQAENCLGDKWGPYWCEADAMKVAEERWKWYKLSSWVRAGMRKH